MNNFLQIGYDFASLEARIEAHYCWKYEEFNQEGIKEYCNSLLQEKPNSVHCLTSKKITKILGREFPRSAAKNVKYSMTYGAQIAKVAKTVGCDLKTAEAIFNAFWEAAYPLKNLKDGLERYWKIKGDKKFILGLDGRKIPTRAQHALLNSLFQSAGVICAKYTAMLHDKLMRDEGLTVDFFKDDWQKMKFVQQLIMYHDEVQLEQHKGMFKFKVFDTKEEALKFRLQDNLFWSEPISGKNNKIVLAWSQAGEFIKQAVEGTTKHFKLNVPLSADYCVGRNWKDCH